MPRIGGAIDVPQVSDPATPAAGRQFFYFKSDGILYTKTSDGVITPFTARKSNLVGFGQLETHSTYTDFNLITDFGYHFVQGTANGPNIPGATQYYSVSLSLGSEYPYSQYVCQIAYPRNVNGVFATRFREGGTWGAWKISNTVKAADSELLDGLDSSAFLRSTAKAADSELLDGLDSTAFLRTTGKAADSELLDGLDSTAFLLTTGKAADSNLLDGLDSTAFVRADSIIDGGVP